MFYELKSHPSATYIIQECQINHDDLVQEFLWGYFNGLFKQWPEKINTDQGWEVAGVRWQGEITDEAGHFPTLHKITNNHTGKILNAGYSILSPGAEIAPHQGYSDAVMRLHYGLVVPTGDCRLVVSNQSMFWHERRGLLFDDTKLHSAFNRTANPRCILLFDLKRK